MTHKNAIVNDAPRKGSRRVKRRSTQLLPNEKVMRPIKPSKKVAILYSRPITRMVRLTRREIMNLYENTTLEIFKELLPSTYNKMPWWDKKDDAAETMVTGGNELHEQSFYKAAQEAVGVNLKKFVNEQGLSEIMEASVDENVQAITDLAESSQRRVAEAVNKSLIQQTGKTVNLRADLLKLFNGDFKTARFIARDQTQRYMNSLNKFRQTAVGIKKYKWVTSKDGRVRESHKRNNGEIFLWSKPPKETGHPGNDYNCRCTASPIIEL